MQAQLTGIKTQSEVLQAYTIKKRTLEKKVQYSVSCSQNNRRKTEIFSSEKVTTDKTMTLEH